MSASEEMHSPVKEEGEEDTGRTRKTRVGRCPIIPKIKKPVQYRWLLEKSQKLQKEKDYESALRYCVEKYKYIYLFRYNDSSAFGFQIFQQVLWPSSRFLLDCCGRVTKAVLGTSSKDELKPGIHEACVPYGDIGFCFSDLPKWKLVREFANYEEFYIPHGAYYDRRTMIFRKGYYIMAGDAQVVHENLVNLGLEKYVQLEEGVENIAEGITINGVVNVLENIISSEANLKQSDYKGHHREFLKEGKTSSFTPKLLGRWNKHDGALKMYGGRDDDDDDDH